MIISKTKDKMKSHTSLEKYVIAGLLLILPLLAISGCGKVSKSTENNITPQLSLTSASSSQTKEGEEFKAEIAVENLNNSEITYTLSNNPEGMVIDENSGVITWTPTSLGKFNFTVLIIGNNSEVVINQTFSIDIKGSDSAPKIDTLTHVLAFPEVPFNSAVKLSTLFSKDVSFLLSDHPEGMTIDKNTGIISWKPESTGTYECTVTVENSLGKDTETFSIEVKYDVFTMISNNEPELINAVSPIDFDIDFFSKKYDQPQEISGKVGSPFNLFVGYTTPFHIGGIDIPFFSPRDISYTISVLSNTGSEITIDEKSGLIYWETPEEGTHTIYVNLLDSESKILETKEFTLSITNTDSSISNPIHLDNIIAESKQLAFKEAYKNHPFISFFSIHPSIPFSSEITYSLKEYPEGMSINEKTGVIYWVPESEGNCDITVVLKYKTQKIELKSTITVYDPLKLLDKISEKLNVKSDDILEEEDYHTAMAIIYNLLWDSAEEIIENSPQISGIIEEVEDAIEDANNQAGQAIEDLVTHTEETLEEIGHVLEEAAQQTETTIENTQDAIEDANNQVGQDIGDLDTHTEELFQEATQILDGASEAFGSGL